MVITNNIDVINKKLTYTNVKNQFLATFCVNVLTCSHGCILGWFATVLPILQSAESPIVTGPITVDESSWIGSLIAIGGISGNLLFGLIASKLGVKNTLYLLTFPQITFWLLIFYGQYVEHLYIARIVSGLTGGGLFACIPLYIAEIADADIRGTLSNILSCAYSLGMLISYVIGSYLSYHTIPLIMISFPILYLCGLIFIPNTPQYHLRNNNIREAEKSLRFYRNCKLSNNDDTKNDWKLFNEEFEKLKSVASHINDDDNKLNFSDFCTPAARKAIFIVLSLITLNAFSGCFVLVTYTVTIFQQSGSDLNPNTSTIIIGVIQFIGLYLSTTLVDKIGRRILLIVSTFGASFGFIVMGTYSYLEKHSFNVSELNWIPVTSLSFVMFIGSVGFLPLSINMIAEILPLKIRTIGLSICITLISLYTFITLKLYPILAELIQLYGCMWLFAIVCALGALLSLFVIKETKGKDINVIDDMDTYENTIKNEKKCNNNKNNDSTV